MFMNLQSADFVVVSACIWYKRYTKYLNCPRTVDKFPAKYFTFTLEHWKIIISISNYLNGYVQEHVYECATFREDMNR